MRMLQAKTLFLPVLLATLLFSPALALAQSFDFDNDIWVGTFGFDLAWKTEPRELILQVILPFASIYIIFLGLLRSFGILRAVSESTEHAISLVVALSALFTGTIGWISSWLSFLGQFSVGVFIFLFFAGAFFYSLGFIRKHNTLKDIFTAYKKDINEINKQLNAVRTDLHNTQMELQRTKFPKHHGPVDQRKVQRLERREADLMQLQAQLLQDKRNLETGVKDAST